MPVSSPPTLFGFGGLRWPPAADSGQRRWCVPTASRLVGKKGGGGGARAGRQVRWWRSSAAVQCDNWVRRGT
jgi:hypothetical protein